MHRPQTCAQGTRESGKEGISGHGGKTDGTVCKNKYGRMDSIHA